MRSLKQQAMHGLAWYGGSRIVIQALSWAVSIVVARLVMPRDYGLLGMALIFIGFISFVNELGFGAAIIQLQEITAEDLDTLFWFNAGTSLVLYAIVVLTAPLVARFFHEPDLRPLLWVTGINVVASGLRTVPWNMLTRAVDFRRRSIAESIGTLAGAGLTLLLAYRGWGVWALAWGFMLPNVVTAFQVYAQTGWRPQCRFARASLRRCLGFSLNVAGQNMAYYLHDNADKFIVGKVLGDQALGFYGFAQRFGMELSGRVVGMTMQIAFPVYARLQAEPERLKRYFLSSTEIVCALMFPLPLGMFLVADDAIPLLLTPKWLPMIPAFKLLCFAAIVNTVHALVSPIVLAKGHAALALRFHLACLLVLPASYLAGTRFGLVGVCWVWLTVVPILVIYWLVRTRPIVGYLWRELWQALRPATLSAALMLAVVELAKRPLALVRSPLARVTIEVALGVTSYVGCLLVLFPHAWREFRRLLRPEPEPVAAASP